MWTSPNFSRTFCSNYENFRDFPTTDLVFPKCSSVGGHHSHRSNCVDSPCVVRVQLLLYVSALLPLRFRRSASASVRYDWVYETNASLSATPLFLLVCKGKWQNFNNTHFWQKSMWSALFNNKMCFYDNKLNWEWSPRNVLKTRTHKHFRISQTGANPRSGAPTYWLAKFMPKTAWKLKKLDREVGAHSLAFLKHNCWIVIWSQLI